MQQSGLEQNLLSAARRIASAGDRAAAVKFLRQRPIPADLAKVDPPLLHAWAELSFLAGQTQLAQKLYSFATESDPDYHWPFFQLGRLAQAAGEFDQAIRMYKHVADLMPSFAWGFYELAQCSLAAGDPAGVEQGLEGFLASEEVELADSHLRGLKTGAHYIYERQRREVAWQIYEFLHDKGVRDSLVQTRRGERRIALQRFDEAIAILEDWPKGEAPNDWGLRSLATAYIAVGKLNDAVATLSQISRRNPNNQYFLRDYIVALHKAGKSGEADLYLQDVAANFPVETAADIRAVHLLYARRYSIFCEELESGALSPSGSVAHEMLDAIFAVSYSERDYALAHKLIVAYATRFGESLDIKLCKLNIAFAMQVWDRAQEVLEKISDEEFSKSLPLRVKRFEYYCFTANLAKAQEALASLEPVAALPAEFVAPVMRYYAEKNAWRDLYQLGIGRLADGFDYAQTGYILFRAIRRTSSHISALIEIERIDGWESNISLRKLRTLVMEDMVHNDSMLEEFYHDPNIAESDALQHRLFFKMRVLRGEQDEIFSKDYAIYFCTNEGYLCATLVAITSLVENNRELMNDASLFIIIDDPLVDYATELVMALGAGLEVGITVLGSGALIPQGTKFNAGYGMFTGGHSLADAAYYRIYAARYLLNLRRYKRGLYIDSDTIILSGLDKLFWLKPGRPLMARQEETRPEIVMASRAHDLEIGTYFNSGVLYLDFTHRDIASRINDTMAAITNPQTKLFFQDQCALNLGFRQYSAPLRHAYNYFVKPDGDGDVADGIIIHFLDRPKPWDPAYPGAICRLWYSYWHKLSHHIGAKAALRLYRIANKS